MNQKSKQNEKKYAMERGFHEELVEYVSPAGLFGVSY